MFDGYLFFASFKLNVCYNRRVVRLPVIHCSPLKQYSKWGTYRIAGVNDCFALHPVLGARCVIRLQANAQI